jgi:hypothetical protein
LISSHGAVTRVVVVLGFDSIVDDVDEASVVVLVKVGSFAPVDDTVAEALVVTCSPGHHEHAVSSLQEVHVDNVEQSEYTRAKSNENCTSMWGEGKGKGGGQTRIDCRGPRKLDVSPGSSPPPDVVVTSHTFVPPTWR